MTTSSPTCRTSTHTAPPQRGLSAEALSLRVTLPTAGAPTVVSITATVEPNAENRAPVVEDDSETYYPSSIVPLEGDRTARTHVLV